MTYSVKEIFYTLQGEGAQTGRTAVFCRFSGCNLWSGREEDRASALCRFCDTQFVGTDGSGGGKFPDAAQLAEAIAQCWQSHSLDKASGSRGKKLVVCTGGEPLLQLDTPLIDALHNQGFEIAVETNGTIAPPPGIDWLTVSPKAGTNLEVQQGSELKLVYPQPGALPEQFTHLTFKHFFLQPMDSPSPLREQYLTQTIDYCLQHPQWRLSLQTHKIIGLR